ncbi:YihY/virulence factor BrkB family protein [Synechococcus sp. AH-551-E05]|nr:YihY/virulence factor BrkB family protein [Synechococcus sp. AH-551-E05]MDB4651339.1 YihY/virulence factor BrkB family protein [Synechococcus sp. AH-551-E05]
MGMAEVRKRQLFRWVVLSLWRASQRWCDAACVDLSAAFAYFTLQSIFPLLLIALSVAARVFGRTDSLDNLMAFIAPILPPSVVDLVDSTLRGLVAQGFGAGILGVAVLLLTASNAYLTLQRGSDRLWDEVLPPSPIGLPFSVYAVQFLRARLEAFVIILTICTLILAEQVLVGIRRLPDDLLHHLDQIVPSLSLLVRESPIAPLGQIFLPMVTLSLMALFLQRVLPSRRVPIMPLIPGSILIGLGLSLLNTVLSLSLFSLGNRFQAYGVIGGVLVLTLWVWLVGVIIYFGQCWSVELAASRLKPLPQGDPNPSIA